jgi:hypothetical protein
MSATRAAVLASAVAIVAVVPLTAATAPSDALKCEGRRATEAGSRRGDTLRGTTGDDVIVARRGKDTVRGRDGADAICGGPGNDILIGQSGADEILGGGGTDTCYGASTTSASTVGDRVAGCERPLYRLLVEIRCTPGCSVVVESVPPGITCPNDCDEEFATNTAVHLTASGGSDHEWEGCDSAEGSRCSVLMDRDRSPVLSAGPT